ncbi:hypothetical protein N7519_001025 [Penicillium mononematosum]|uniref:uncharacterized protein n=1 Tax=Penicillium mononematosum TaxID=268346 RepID=UPI002548768C|nr:uncharacterized protein N7519_001025 [Penicillium mononematosum]KAJ6191004.1 hypothetical protein N7519_001025 [Penicillium mononematosum]
MPAAHGSKPRWWRSPYRYSRCTRILMQDGRFHGPFMEPIIQHRVVPSTVDFVDRVVQGNMDEAHFERLAVIVALRSELQNEVSQVSVC